MLLAQAHHLLHLGKDLPFSQHQGIEARCHPQEVGNGLLVVEGEQVGGELLHLKTGMAA